MGRQSNQKENNKLYKVRAKLCGMVLSTVAIIFDPQNKMCGLTKIIAYLWRQRDRRFEVTSIINWTDKEVQKE